MNIQNSFIKPENDKDWGLRIADCGIAEKSQIPIPPRKRIPIPPRSGKSGWAGVIAVVRKHPGPCPRRGSRKGRGVCMGTNPGGPNSKSEMHQFR